jgi:integrase
MGTLYKRRGSKKYMMAVMVDGRQRCKTTKTSNKRRAEKRLSQWETQVDEGQYHLTSSTPPYFEKWAGEFLQKIKKIPNPNTRRRYASSIGKLLGEFSGVRLSHVSADRIEHYKEGRLEEGVESGTINHDLRVLRRMLRLAERKRLISRNPFVEVEFLRQGFPREPHILTFEEEARILSVAMPYLRVLVILILETGMRSHREALALRWDAVDFVNDLVRVKESKTRAGIRNIPLSTRCREELLRWREELGHDFSPFVFPNSRKPQQSMRDVRHSWKKALNDAGIQFFWIYNLRHSNASRLSAAGVPDLFVAQMIGHSTPGILQKYSKATDEYQRDAIRKVEQLRVAYTKRGAAR